MPIRVLDATVAAQIAAGEVVERPASVIKELVENALDAGARRIQVSMRGGGIEELVIQDDGCGIPADEITVAFERHATSKLSSADDLWAINTLGFRGEALPSIASIAQVICLSRTADAEMGTELRIAGGEIQALNPRGASVGTTFTIRNLFYNVPVRREFLKSPAAEASAITAIITQYALAYPHISFTLQRDGRRVFQTSGRGQLSDVILELYGVEVARQMIEVSGSAGEGMTAVSVEGLISAPSLSRNARDGMHITVNGRAVQPRGMLSSCIEEAYHTRLMKGRFPIVALKIEVHPAAVDVNVHPTKSEVKFRQPHHISRVIGMAIHEALQNSSIVQRWAETQQAQQAQQAAAEVNRERTNADTIDRALSRPPALARQEPEAPVAVPPPPVAAVPPPPIPSASSDADYTTRRNYEPPQLQEHASVMETPARLPERVAPAPQAMPEPPRVQERLLDASVAKVPAAAAPLTTPQAKPSIKPEVAPIPVPSADTPLRTASAAAPQSQSSMPPLRALAQLAQTYLLTEGPEGALYLIDQHAAHERITYERLLAQHAQGHVESQALLMPQTVVLPPQAQQTLLAAEEALASWGFRIREGDGGVVVESVPLGIEISDMRSTLADLASHLDDQGKNTLLDQRDLLLATLACHTSVRAGQSLSLAEQQALIEQLQACAGPRTCPHGRPTLIVITKHQLERQFGRLGA
jgi:DNA mismatch repair protein MutL